VRKPTENDALEQRVLLNFVPIQEEEREQEEEKGCNNDDNKKWGMTIEGMTDSQAAYLKP